MNKVEEMKQWQSHQASKYNDGNISTTSSKYDSSPRKHQLDLSSPLLQLTMPGNFNLKSKLDNGMYIVDKMLSSLQRKENEPNFSNKPFVQETNNNQPTKMTDYPSEPSTNKAEYRLIDLSEKHNISSDVKPKPFLRRGQGLSRFRMKMEDFKKPVPKPSFKLKRIQSNSVTSENVGSCRNKRRGTRPALTQRPPFNLRTTEPFEHHKKDQPPQSVRKPNPTPPMSYRSCELSKREPPHNRISKEHISYESSRGNNLSKAALDQLAVWSNVFQKDKEKLSSSELPQSPLSNHRSQNNKTSQKENEEQEVFDILEEKAQDTSFSSTSSMVAKLMEKSVRSTPVKQKSQQNLLSDSNPFKDNTHHSEHVKFSDHNVYHTIEEADESADSRNISSSSVEDSQQTHKSAHDRPVWEHDTNYLSEYGTKYTIQPIQTKTSQPAPVSYTVDPIPIRRHTADSTEEVETSEHCGCESDSCSCAEDTIDQHHDLEKAIQAYKPVMNPAQAPSSGLESRSELDEYLKYTNVNPPLKSALKQKTNSSNLQTNNNKLVEQTRQLLDNIRKDQEERVRKQMEEEENKENKKKKANKKQPFPKTVYQETFKKQKSKNIKKGGSTTGLKPFGDNSTPNPFVTDVSEQMRLNTELLKKRLEDLENEIHVFRLENIKLNKLRKQFDLDQKQFENRKKQFKEETEKQVEEFNKEKQKLNKDKKIFLSNIKNIPTQYRREEREEINNLKKQIESLKTEMINKETKWGANQARLRNHIKLLETQNAKLKTENENLNKQAKKVSFSNKKEISNAQIMNAISSQLNKLAKSDIISGSSQPKPPTSILKRATPLTQPQEVVSNYNLTKTTNQTQDLMPEDSFDKIIYQSLITSNDKSDSERCQTPSSKQDNSRIPIETLNLIQPDAGASEYEKDTTERDALTETVQPDGTTEKKLADGRTEIFFPNGNKQIKSHDGSYIKTFFFNGDIKETNTIDHTVHYYYSNTGTWHTTKADGMQIIVFADGQKDTRFKDGTVQSEYRDGRIRIKQKNGDEVCTYKDGEVERIEKKGEEMILTLRNGQKEIHTKDFKRREYPDGTVKIVYPDGIQETRYSNGRIRTKNVNGSLILDTHEGIQSR